MSQIILDFGSGNTHKNNWGYLKRMFDELKAIDTGKHEVIIKHQLFEKAGDNIPLDHLLFDAAFDYAKALGYKTTASVFDLNSLRFLLDYDIPFIKIANRRDLDWLIGEVPRKIPVYVSYGTFDEYDEYNRRKREGITTLACISKYPAEAQDYIDMFGLINIKCEHILSNLRNVSDHTIGLDLFKKYQPRIWEKHYKLSDSIGLDAGPFAITPEELKEIL